MGWIGIEKCCKHDAQTAIQWMLAQEQSNDSRAAHLFLFGSKVTVPTLLVETTKQGHGPLKIASFVAPPNARRGAARPLGHHFLQRFYAWTPAPSKGPPPSLDMVACDTFVIRPGNISLRMAFCKPLDSLLPLMRGQGRRTPKRTPRALAQPAACSCASCEAKLWPSVETLA